VVIPDSISIGSAILQSSVQTAPKLYNGLPFRPSKLPFPWGFCTPSNTGVLDPNGISIGWAVFAEVTTATDRQTDWHNTLYSR